MESVLSERDWLLVAVLNTYFSKVLLISSFFVHLLLPENYEQGVLQKELIIAPLMENLKQLLSENLLVTSISN